ncbi:Activating signal cointegrator 1 complex subunit 3-like protein [Leptotrombidium deliense]|uniref:Activating signal cointegrator 1 complex subunit 3-like protein n=1 Tax=Leptotrombidium deliense TaxID=299467 RepID=A0A443SV00_9ACAR|nr:Activating signal cointegrator 1 complex subunit 3-like protein [Leptotrombidium deliense]
MIRVPRLSEYLRTRSNNSRPLDREDNFDEHSYLRTQRVKAMKQLQRNQLPNWTQLRDALKGSSKAKNLTEKEIHHRLNDVLASARQLTGNEWPSDLVESVAVYVLQLTYDSMFVDNSVATINEQKHKLNAMFGCFNNELLSKVYEQCKFILNSVEKGDLIYLFDHNHNIKPTKSGKARHKAKGFEYLKDTEWQQDYEIECDLFRCPPDLDLSYLSWDSMTDEQNKKKKEVELSFQYIAPVTDSSNETEIDSSVDRNSELIVKRLRDDLQKFCNENAQIMPVADLMECILTFLEEKQNIHELEHDLLSFLGTERLTLIRDIISNREQIIGHLRGYSQESVIIKQQNYIPLPSLSSKQPSITQSVVIQTAEEKQLQKLHRKFEKKALKKGEGSDFEKVKVDQRLMNAMVAPIFRDPTPFNTKSYPFVFDSYAEAKQSAAYICGHKMILPTNFTRQDNRQWEEISIPPATKLPPHVADKFKIINIETELNEIGKKVFSGVKNLNQIQSIVYQTASNGNSNMLVCAPTGAGKTNIALLAVLNEINKNLDPITNKVKKDQFKIVYIAPMKALAAEMTDNFSKKLKPLDINVRELTGDMQLSKAEIMNTQMIVTTPEKWDVVTRKSKGDVQLLLLVRLLIIDEVHLLQTDRGPVLEALVARTIRHVESTQQMIRLIGLSATLPNYMDVAEFLRVNPNDGLFFFDNRFRPVALHQTFVGCKGPPSQQAYFMDDICYEKVYQYVKKGHQCMVFVHTRNSTFKTAMALKERAQREKQIQQFQCDVPSSAIKSMGRSRNKQLQELFEAGFAIHHAGMLRQDRSMVEKFFRDGYIKVLVCTSTLAWGVNLPAHAVIIKGTEIYDSAHGKLVDLSMLDVVQIFGRAGRPQYDTEGHGTIITSHDKLQHYLSMLTNQYPIESNFLSHLTDNLNAEIVLGTITTIEEAIEWLSYTYAFVRMVRRPMVYGIAMSELENDPLLYDTRRNIIMDSATLLDSAKMVRYDDRSGTLDPTDLGRTASHYYIKYNTVQKFNELLFEDMLADEIMQMLCEAEEFDQLKSREEEMDELKRLHNNSCVLRIKGGMENTHGKVNILLQSYLSRDRIESFSLTSDRMYITQNVIRMARGMFEYVLKKGYALLARKLLILCKMLEKEMWDHETPFMQFRCLSFNDIEKIEKLHLTPEKIRSDELTTQEIARLMRVDSKGQILKKLARTLPNLDIVAVMQPITRTVLRVTLEVTPNFIWDDSYHGKISETFWIWMQDADSNHIYYFEHFVVTKKQVVKKETQLLVFTIPLLSADSVPSHYIIHCDSEYWLGCLQEESVPCKNIILPDKFLPFTKLLDLEPLPITALQNPIFESIYTITHFNPIQTQIFHTLYHTDANALIGAPTGSGKTICAEVAMMRVFQNYTQSKVVYIAPLKALVRERVDDWKVKLEGKLGKKVVELTGDVMPDVQGIMESDVIVTTPEKWDGVSRSWQTRRYVRDVALIVIDEIHLLGEDRGPVLEVIVSRTNFIVGHTGNLVRVVGLSTAIANAQDLASWLRIGKIGMYNFKPQVRPVPLEVHVSGYPGKHYCPRMALMNKPTFRAIKQHSPKKPVIVFVSSRRQTRLTAFDLIAFVAQDNPKQWLHMSDEEMDYLINNNVNDTNLKMTLAFGVGLHHAGLQEKDRSLVEELFLHNKIQVLITTATLAWGINLPAHLVVIKGTEYFDGKQHRYVDFPITDVLQMMGRAGRPQFDTEGKAVILVQETKKEYYKKFLYEPFPVESSLKAVLAEHLNAEIVAGTVSTKQDCIDYMTWTYFFRRILKNPSYYGLDNVEPQNLNKFLTELIDTTVSELIESYCLEIDLEDERTLIPTAFGRITSYYYLQHKTVRMLNEQLIDDSLDFQSLLNIISKCHEFNELPVRHNEEILNADLSKDCRYTVNDLSFDNPNTKAFLLFQAHFSQLELPCSDYLTDLKSVLDQSIRIIQAMIDIVAMKGFLSTTLKLMIVMQMITQARWFDECTVMTLPFVEKSMMSVFAERLHTNLPQLMDLVSARGYEPLVNSLITCMEEYRIAEVHQILLRLPIINIQVSLRKLQENEEQTNDRSDKIGLEKPNTAIARRCYQQLEADTEYMLTVKCVRQNSGDLSIQRTKAFAPKFPKKKDECWFLVLGDANTSELSAMKRVGYIASSNVHNLVFRTPSKAGLFIYKLYFISDCYLGLDQEYDLNIEIAN